MNQGVNNIKLPNTTLQPTVKKLRFLPSAELARWASPSRRSNSDQTKKRGMILTTTAPEKPKFRNELVSCDICKIELLRKHLAKHKRTAHNFGVPLILTTRLGIKSPILRTCSECSNQSVATWLFQNTSRGPVSLCATCKSYHVKNSFSREALEKKRVTALKATLNELIVKLRNQSIDTFQPGLKAEIAELKISIKRSPTQKYRWSPVLPGSFGSGKRH